MLAIGAISVLWWQASGDLRFYVLVQFLPVILIPAILLLYPSGFPGAKWTWAVLAVYAVAKVLEFFDVPIFHVLGVSGHSLKHIIAAIAVCFVALLVRARNPVRQWPNLSLNADIPRGGLRPRSGPPVS
jgi:hypothetical protein